MFLIVPPQTECVAVARVAVSSAGQEIAVAAEYVDYPHIEPQQVLVPAEVTLVRTDIRCRARKIGYVMGAGDKVNEAIRQLGEPVHLIGAPELVQADLTSYDVIVTGVRAFNVREDLRRQKGRLLEYVRTGGTLIVQYNVSGRGDDSALDGIGPYSFRIGGGRITVEESPVIFLKPDHKLLNFPNKITARDFEGWVQERGLHFASSWDARYEAILSSADPDEPAQEGGLLFARYGRGVFVYCAYGLFRQLPAGVPGAYRLLANLLSSGRD